MSGTGDVVRIRLLFADDGSYHHEEVSVPAGAFDSYERLIDFVREDEEVLKRLYVDVERLCAATVVEDGAEHEGGAGR